MTRYLLLGLFLVGLIACFNDRPTRFDHTTPEKEKTGPDYKGEDRHIWQNPAFILSLIDNFEGATIADIGAGSGYFAYRFLQRGARVIAVDIDPRMIDLMEKEVGYFKDTLKSKFETRLASSNDPRLGQGEVDYIFMSNTYPYIEDRVNYFSKLRTCLKAHGKIIIVDFRKKRTSIGPPMESRVAMGEVEEELIQAGYNVISSDDKSLDYQYIVIASP